MHNLISYHINPVVKCKADVYSKVSYLLMCALCHTLNMLWNPQRREICNNGSACGAGLETKV